MKEKTKNARMFFLILLMTVLFTLPGVKGNSQPVKPWIAPASALQEKNPFEADKSSAAKEGKKLYVTYCTPCHGNGGKGDGIAAASLNPKPANHTSDAVQNEPDASLYWKMSTGRGPMVSYKQVLTDNQRWQLVCYIKTLGKK